MRKLLVAVFILGLILAGCAKKQKETSNGALQAALDMCELGKMPDFSALRMIETNSGLQYFDLKDGEGIEAGEGSFVTVHYHGWLMNKRKFDSSIKRQEPLSFTIGEGKVIRGWEEGIQGMQVGTYRLLRIPSKLGYGTTGFPGAIPPDAPLIFFVKLIAID